MKFQYIFIYLLILIKKSIQVGFPKDLSVNTQFPPILERRDGIPMGHLRPLGWQNRPQSGVAEESVKLESINFWKKYVLKNKPVVIRGLINGASAIDRWSDSYLSRTFSNIDINVKSKKQKIIEKSKKMKFKEFLEGYKNENWYLRVIMPFDMQPDIPIPHIINCGPYTQQLDNNLKKKVTQLIEPYLWMSAGETSSLLHLHSVNNLHCLIDGRKDFILMSTDQLTKKNYKNWKTLLNLHEKYKNSNEYLSKIDVDMVNAFEYKILHEIIWYWSTLRTGDCIYIPNTYLHQVRSFGRSISSTVSFTLLATYYKNEVINNSNYDNELFQSCERNAPLFKPMHLSNDHFMFAYTHGDRHLVKRNMNYVDAKYYLLFLLQNNTNLYFEKFDHSFDEITSELKTKVQSRNLILNSTEIWNSLDKTGKKYLTFDDIDSLNENDVWDLMVILNAAANVHQKDYDEL